MLHVQVLPNYSLANSFRYHDIIDRPSNPPYSTARSCCSSAPYVGLIGYLAGHLSPKRPSCSQTALEPLGQVTHPVSFSIPFLIASVIFSFIALFFRDASGPWKRSPAFPGSFFSTASRAVSHMHVRSAFSGQWRSCGMRTFIKIVAVIAAVVIVHVCSRCPYHCQRIRCWFLSGRRCLVA